MKNYQTISVNVIAVPCDVLTASIVLKAPTKSDYNGENVDSLTW